MTHDIETRDDIIASLSARLDVAQAEVERLRVRVIDLQIAEVRLAQALDKIERLKVENEQLTNHADHVEEESGWRDCMALLNGIEQLKAEVERLKVVIRGLMDACDRLMGDSDLPDDESFEMQAMQRAAAILGGRNDRRIERGEHWPLEERPTKAETHDWDRLPCAKAKP